MSRADDLKKQELEEELASLTEGYTAVTKQRRQTRDERDRLILQKQAEDLLKQIEKAEKDLKELENTPNNYHQNHLNIHENLPEIDFCQAMDVVDKITDAFGKHGGAALFLLENSYSMAGELLIYKIREKLERKTRSFKHIQIEISTNNSYSESGLLTNIAGYFNVPFDEIDNLTQNTQKIIHKIGDSLQSGSVIFFEINKWDCLPEKNRLLSWFTQEFWCSLIDKCKLITQEKKLLQVKFITVIDSESHLDEGCLDLSLCCTHDNFNSQKILKLPLSEWRQEDIQEWLEYYSGLPEPQINFKAKQIYAKTMNGIPRMVCNALREELK
jgi:hypothetical protein